MRAGLSIMDRSFIRKYVAVEFSYSNLTLRAWIFKKKAESGLTVLDGGGDGS